MGFTKRGVVAWMLLLLTMLFAGASSAMETGLDVPSLLRRPGVKLVAVEFYADWCKPCMAAVPKWKALHEKYRAKGLHLVVVSVGDQAGCSSPGWNPDLTVCDLDTSIQKRLGANPLPQAFLWNWQGQLIASHAPVEQVEAAIERYFAETPRILVSDPKDENGAPVKNVVALREQIKTLLKNQAKFDLVASASEQATLKALRKESHAAAYDEAGACEVGSAVSANSELKVKVLNLAPGRRKLLLQLYSVEQGCLKAASDAPIQGTDTEGAVFTAVSSLVEQLIGRGEDRAPTAPAPAKAAPAPTDNYEELMAKAQKVAGTELPKEDKVNYVKGFLAKYPVGNPRQAEAEALIKDIEADRVIAKAGANSIGAMMVKIPAGSFMMGSPSGEEGRDNDETQHRVTLTKGFLLGATEVTQGQWQAVMGSNPSYFKDCGAECPVEQVSWTDVVEFCNKLSDKEGLTRCYSGREWNRGCTGYRLPTEAEWEYAARAGSSEARYGEVGSVAWYDQNSGSKTHPAGQKQANAWGLYDMLGNVWEWVWDWYGAYPSGDATDPVGPTSGSYRVVRGGAWSIGALDARAADRNADAPGHRVNDLGFRLSRSLP